MRSSEFLNEAGPEGTPMTDAEFAAQQAQGAKNLDSIKGFGRKIAGALGGGAQAATPYPDAATARASLTPSQLKWLGGADPMDKYIMARMPAPLPGETVAAPPVVAPAAPVVAPVKTTGTGYGDDDTSVFAPTPVNNVQTTTPPAKTPARSTISPAILGYASSMGLYKNGQPDTAAIKAFQQKNGLKVDGLIGPNTSGAILSAAKPGDAGSGRGGAGGPTATQMAQNATPPANEKLGPTNTMPRNPMYAPARPSTGYTAQMAWDQQYGKTHSTSGAPKSATPRPSTGYAAQAAWDRQNAAAPANPVRESNFEESVSRMRRLSTLLKG